MIVLLMTNDMMSTRPQEVEIKFDWGPLTMVVGDDFHNTIDGHHVAIEGPEKAIKEWLRPYDGVWFGVGSPMMQEFEVGHIKED